MNKTTSLFKEFANHTISELEELLNEASNREESLFYQRVLALKLGLEQEKVVGKKLL